MPEDIAADPVQSKIWAWVAPEVNAFTEQDVPTLRLLVHWHAVAAQAQQDMRAESGRVEIYVKDGATYDAELDETVPLLKEHPALKVLKKASAEIRALSDMLGLSPLARSRIGLMDATKTKTAADTAAMFRSIDAAYGLPEAEVVGVEDVD